MGHFDIIKNRIASCYSGTEVWFPYTIMKSHDAVIGEIHTWADGHKYKKTIDGWEKVEETKNKVKRVEHEKFGQGTVISDDGKIMKINFDDHGEKQLLKQYAKVKDLGEQSESVKPEKSNEETTNKVEGNDEPLNETELYAGKFVQIKHGEKYSSVKINSVSNGKIGYWGKDVGGGSLNESDFRKLIKPESKNKISEGVSAGNVEILKDTDKAYLIKKDNKQGWIPKNWVHENSGNKILTFKKQFAKRAEDSLEVIKEPIISNKFKINKETDKAYLIGMKIKDPVNNEIKNIDLWFPKSKVSFDGDKFKIDNDFFETKKQEINEKYSAIQSSFPPSVITEKAIGYPISVYENLSEQTVGRTLWFPKSQVSKQENDTYIIPKWLYDKRVEELYDSVKTGGWSMASNSVFEMEGLENFNKKEPEIIKSQTE